MILGSDGYIYYLVRHLSQIQIKEINPNDQNKHELIGEIKTE